MPVDLCFVPQVNDFRGHRSVQFLICAVRPSETLDTCRCILEMEEFSVEELRIFRPGRDELARAWRRIKQFGGRIEFRYEELSGGRRDFMFIAKRSSLLLGQDGKAMQNWFCSVFLRFATATGA